MKSGNQNELRTLMAEALELCTLLQQCSDDNLEIFKSEDDEKIVEIINHREDIIDALVSIESRIDSMLDDTNPTVAGQPMPPEVEELRRSVRAKLDAQAAKDLELMKIISSKMHKYRNETLKARSKQNLSAYMHGADSGAESGDSIDLSK